MRSKCAPSAFDLLVDRRDGSVIVARWLGWITAGSIGEGHGVLSFSDMWE